MHNMNKQIVQTVSNFLSRAFAGALVACALVVTSFSSVANAQQFSTTTDHPEIKYLGTVEDKLVFQIDLKSVSAKQSVSIRDEQGNTLYTERIDGTTFSRKFAFEKEEFEGKKVSFVIHGGKASSAQTFQVARNWRTIEDLVITKL